MPIHEPVIGEELYYYKRRGGIRRKLKVRVLEYPAMYQGGGDLWDSATVQLLEVLEDSTGEAEVGAIADVNVRDILVESIPLDDFVRATAEELIVYLDNLDYGEENENNGLNENENYVEPPLEHRAEGLLIPEGSESVISKNTIQTGNLIVNWRNAGPGTRRESEYGRYYTLDNYGMLPLPKMNPVTRQPIENVKLYTAIVNPLTATNTSLFDGGRRRRSKHRSKRTRRSIKKRKASSRRRKNGTLRRNV